MSSTALAGEERGPLRSNGIGEGKCMRKEALIYPISLMFDGPLSSPAVAGEDEMG